MIYIEVKKRNEEIRMKPLHDILQDYKKREENHKRNISDKVNDKANTNEHKPTQSDFLKVSPSGKSKERPFGEKNINHKW